MSVNETLAGYSNLLLYSAMASYTGAFLSFTLDLAGGPARVRQAREAAARVTAPVKEPVAAGVAGGSGGESIPGLPVTGRRGRGSGDRAGTTSGEPKRTAASIAVSLTTLALLLHLGSVLLRGLSVDRPPWGNMFEFSTAGSAVVTLVFLAALRWRDLRYLGTFVIGPVLLTLGLAITVLYTAAAQLAPSLRSYWLAIHVTVAFISSALFTIAFSATVLYLVQDVRERRRREGRAVGLSFMEALPSSRELDQAAYRLHALAFPLWTFTLVAGSIWAENAWGRYWGWDPKEVWTFVIWVVYAGYLHARATRGWEGRKAARLALIGYACVLFNFLVVNIVFVGMHSYAGVS
ncbi:MAG TPA: c-type cytochrome biogenesis protein CcsB [Actinomycetales bacterium]|nr:c-type cytochrome biogenesis protein CcsB [Actinomycetales bacterium]